jgi:hypothetical protein
MPGERRADGQGPVIDTAPTLGLSKAFNSLDATMKLAAQTGMIDALKDSSLEPSPSAIVAEMRRGPGWTAKDKVIFLASVAGATAVGAFIVFA